MELPHKYMCSSSFALPSDHTGKNISNMLHLYKDFWINFLSFKTIHGKNQKLQFFPRRYNIGNYTRLSN